MHKGIGYSNNFLTLLINAKWIILAYDANHSPKTAKIKIILNSTLELLLRVVLEKFKIVPSAVQEFIVKMLL